MKETHVELIDPMEKISPELGGTGYVGPKAPANIWDLRVDALNAAAEFPDLNMTVWKVLRSSVNWNRGRTLSRRIRVDGRTIPCQVIGSIEDWWFVSVEATRAIRVLQ